MPSKPLPDLLFLGEYGETYERVGFNPEIEDPEFIPHGWRARSYEGEEHYHHQDKDEVVKWLAANGYQDTGDGYHFRLKKDTSPFVKPTLVKKMVRIQEVNTPPAPNTFDITVEYSSDELPEWFAPLQPVLEDETVNSMTITIGGGRVVYKIETRQA